MTDYSELIDTGRLQRGRFSRTQVEDCLGVAERDLAAARAILRTSPDWALNIAYNAMQQAGRGLLYHRGYRTVGTAHHVTVVRFLELDFGDEHRESLALFDRLRRKRNRATYGVAGTVSLKEAQEAIPAAAEFIAEIKRRVAPVIP